MNLSLRAKLSLAICGIIALVGIAALSYVNVSFQGHLLTQIETDLTHQARTIRSALEGSRASDDLDPLVDRLGRGIPTRITLIRIDGKVLADTSRSGTGLTRLDDHSRRPEVREALRSDRGVSIRRSPSLGIDMMYVAIPWEQDGRLRGTVRTALPLRSVKAILGQVRRTLIVATLGAMTLTLLITWSGSRFLLRTLLNLISAARSIASGEHADKLMTDRRDELGELARALRDVTNEIAGQVALLRRERSQLEAILNSLREGVLVMNREGRVILANNAAREFLGFSGQLEGESLGVVVRHPRLREILATALEADAGEMEDEWELTGPEPINLIVHTADFDFGKDDRGMVAVFYDITERKRLESVRRDFVASASHELRTPVTAIRGFAETLRDGALDDLNAARPFVENLHRQSLRLSTLVEDLLSLSRLESGEGTISVKEIDLEPVVQAARRQVEFAAMDKDIRFIVEILAKKVMAEEVALEQVLVNLLDNAVKYSPEGRSICVTSKQSATAVTVSVRDEGIGIPGEHQARIFERFYRVDPARSRELGGTGLGLAIVKHLVQSLGGRVEVESAPVAGSTFKVILPLG